MDYELKRVGLAFKTDGEVDFRKTLAEVNNAVKDNYATFRLAQSQWDKSTTTQEKLATRQEYLAKQTDVYSDKVQVLKLKLEDLEKAEEKDEKAIEKTKAQLNGAQATLNNYSKELNAVSNDIKNNITVSNEKYQKSLEDVNDKLKDNTANHKLAQSQWDKSTTSQQKLRTEQEFLTKQTETYSEKIKLLKDRLRELENAEEKDANAIKDTKEKLQEAQVELNNYSKELNKVNEDLKYNVTSLNEFSEKLGNVGEKTTEAGKKLTSTVTAGVVGLGVASVKTAADFESAMSEVSAISGATGDDFNALAEKAREMGSKTKFSATESAEAMNYMAMAGWKTEDMLSGIEGIMNLATASGEDLATTSDIVTDALTAFGLSAKDSSHFADVLAASASNANTNVSMMGESFKYCAPTAGALGYSVEDVGVAIGLMGNAGIKASQAGTALNNLFTRLAKPTDESATAMERLGITLADDQGQMYSFGEIMEQLRNSFGAINMPIEEFNNQIAVLDQALEDGTITEDKYNKAIEELTMQAYGAEGAEKARAAAMLAGQTGMSGMLAIVNASTEDYNKLRVAIDECDGTAERMSEIMQNNLNGQIENLKSAVSEAGIAIGQELLPTIKDIVENIKEWVDWFNQLDEGQKKTILTIIAVVAAIGPLLIVIGTLCSSISKIITLFTTLAPVIGAINAPILIIIVAITALIATGVLLYKNWDKVKEGASKVWDGVKLAFNTGISFVKTLINGFISFVTSIPKKVVDIFKGIGSTIKGIFNFVIDLPKIKLPHFNVTPKGWKIGDLLSGTIPKLGINWYAKGGILNRPTIFGQSGDKLLGGGEAGQEAVLPISLLKEYIDTANQVSEERLLSVLTTVLGKTMTEAFLKALKLYAPEITLDGEVVGELLSKWFREEVIA